MSEAWELTKQIGSLVWSIAVLLLVLSFMIRAAIYDHRGDMQHEIVMLAWAILLSIPSKR